MTHKPIQIKNISLFFSHKTCFDDFTATINCGSRIAIIGRNGSGKSTLLNIISGKIQPTTGDVIIPNDVVFGYVSQIVDEFDFLSGGERFNKSLTEALSTNPNVLLLDEPTNHLDSKNRKSLMRMMNSTNETLIVISHDVELLRNCVDTLWHIENNQVHIFSGNYDNYIREMHIKHASIEEEFSRLKKQKQDIHKSLMKEQVRASKSKSKGELSIENRKWPTIVSNSKASRASHTSGKKKSEISNKKESLNEKLSDLYLPEIIKPKFSLNYAEIGNYTILSINDGCVGYGDVQLISNINLSVASGERIAILGNNGSGKSTIIKAILNNNEIVKSGDWYVPKLSDIGYLDQHYGTICPNKSVVETIHECSPLWNNSEIRRHLNDFLFRKNEEVNAVCSTLSGGEKARLSLAQIAANTPKLLILDEITNNIDLETKEHISQILLEYPGAMIVISHDEDFIEKINIIDRYYIDNKTFLRRFL